MISGNGTGRAVKICGVRRYLHPFGIINGWRQLLMRTIKDTVSDHGVGLSTQRADSFVPVGIHACSVW